MEPPMTLRPPRHTIERRAIGWWILQSLAFPGPVLVASIVAFVLWESARPWLVVAVAGATLVQLTASVVEPLWRYRVHRWEVTDDAVYALTGWLVREWRVTPISRVQTVDAIQGPAEQLLGLSTLRVTTASSQGAVNIVGLNKGVAAEVAERLAAITQDTPGDAT
ncbi:hypothetical protein E1281_25770 [Actinomadura sp. KC345]|uniref:PH domain-containing protein n=1 Tax=Actinomadura sp. KC345 TaxID=2530371 RepID=UPI00104E0FBA|nr:PH domain-containing protein [Actinomadura sp. KC345]TDC47750.1 hypothetical protein E1281_25770 [Actinomadura sp. KC345]